jgi:drug/metabolite transporter (DMT)-like permease
MGYHSSNFKSRWGYGFVVLAALLWASGGTASKFLFNNGLSPFQLVQLRVTICGVVLFAVLGIRRPSLLRISRGDILYFAILGIFGMAAVQFFYLFAISKINVAAAILLEYLAPVFIALHTLVFTREKLNGYVIAAIAGAVAGCYLVVGAYNLNLLTLNAAGILGGIGAAVSFAWFSVHGEYGMRRYDPWTVFFYGSLFALVVWNILQPPFQSFRQSYSLEAWFWIGYVGVMGTILPFGLYYQGINLIRSTRASITATLEPIIAGLISYLFLNEVMSPLQMMGGVLVIGSIILLQVKHEVDNKAPGVLRSRKTGNDAI